MTRLRIVVPAVLLLLGQAAMAGNLSTSPQAASSDIGPIELLIGRVFDGSYGRQCDVTIEFMNRDAAWPVAGFNLLIQYDAEALVFQKATAGTFLSDCAWEYFSFRFGAEDDCGLDHCPPGVLRLVALAEMAGGSPTDHPECYTNDGIIGEGGGSSTSTELARLTFQIMDDPNIGCTFAPVRFLWNECGDNTLTGAAGDTQLISSLVYDCAGSDLFNNITGLDNVLPTLTGAPTPECDTDPVHGIVRGINFYDGGVDIICVDSTWNRIGDINCNGKKFEVADAIMYANYFHYGLAAFGSHIECSIAAADVNQDGHWGTLADLVLLIRIVVGDVNPYAKDSPPSPLTAGYTLEDGVLAVTGDYDIGGAALTVKGSLTPELLAADLEMSYSFDGSVTRILVIPPYDATAMPSFRGAFLSGIHGEIVTLELVTPQGASVAVESVPARFDLSQNYPNPFNPVTTIEFSLPTASPFRLTIFNIEGRMVYEFHGRVDAPGAFHVDWNAGDRASGVYLYRLDAGQFSQTRKMLLLK